MLRNVNTRAPCPRRVPTASLQLAVAHSMVPMPCHHHSPCPLTLQIVWNTCNMKHVQHPHETDETFKAYTYNICVKHMHHQIKHLQLANMKTCTRTYSCNIYVEHVPTSISDRLQHTSITNETFWTTPLKHLQHGSKTIAICATSPIYLCNIHMKQLQHTSETSKTLETYTCNMRFHRNISLLRSCVTTATMSFMCFFLEYPKEFRGSCV